jgi:glycosyltransferase involved in cell wall biosynthesis
MRVLFINPVATLGGAERVLLDALEALRRLRPNLERALLVFESGPLVALAEATGATVRVLELPEPLRALGERAFFSEPWRMLRDGPKLVGGLAGFFRSFRSAVAEIGPDLLHTNGFKAHFLAAALRDGTPALLHAHDFLNGRPVSKRLVRLAERQGLHVVANSRAVAAEYAEAMPRTRVHALHNAVDEAEFRPWQGDKFWLAELAGLPRSSAETVVFGMVGTYARWKGQPLFLEAARKVVAAGGPERFRFFITGGPQYATRGSQFSEAELRAKIDALGLTQVAGLVPFQERVADVYRSLDVLVHPSTEPEPFGKSIVEGMACGRAVIVAASGGSVELFEEGVSALGFRRGDASELAAKMLLLAHDKELRQRLGQEARSHVERHFALPRFGQGLCAIYDEICPERSGR